MTTTLQFVVAGALIVAWSWMLGRPILTSLFRRSRRDSVGHFRYQQAVLSQQSGPEPRAARLWADRPRPLLAWRAQPLERRRLQIMLGFAMATFVSMLSAIALRGPAVRFFLVMVACFVAYLCVAAYIGSVQLRRQHEVRASRGQASSAERRAESTAAVAADVVGPSTAPAPSSGVAEVQPVDDPAPVQQWQGSVLFPEGDESLEHHDRYGGVFDEDFFEPIPELVFEPLNLDSSLLDPSEPDSGSLFGEDLAREGNFFDRLVGRDETGDYFAIDEDGWIAEPVAESQEFLLEPEPVEQPESDRADQAAAEADSEVQETRSEPTFTAPPRKRPPKRTKARPIYIESQLDEGDDQIKAVND